MVAKWLGDFFCEKHSEREDMLVGFFTPFYISWRVERFRHLHLVVMCGIMHESFPNYPCSFFFSGLR